jgi:hypothetical protein
MGKKVYGEEDHSCWVVMHLKIEFDFSLSFTRLISSSPVLFSLSQGQCLSSELPEYG